MNVQQLMHIIGGTLTNKKYEQKKVGSINIDSRTFKKGEVFLAFKGNRFDGHSFISDVLKKKPSCLIVEEGCSVKTKVPVIYVQDTNQAFFDLAKYYRKEFSGLVIAITGSCGKTSTKEFLSHILSKEYCVMKNEKNFNNIIGISKTLMRLQEDTQILILECGTNHPGEMKVIEKLVKPDIVLITNIGISHIGNFKNKKAIKKEKLALIKPMEEGVVFLHGEDSYLRKLRSSKVELFKTYNVHSLISLRKVLCLFDKSVIELEYHGIYYHIKCPIVGKGMVNNLLLAIECSVFLNISIPQIIKALETFPALDSRLEKVKLSHHNLLLNDCYNASFESIISLLEIIQNVEKHKVIVLGEMKELGTWSKKLHKQIGKKIKAIENIELYLVGNETKVIQKQNKNSIWFSSNEELIQYLQNKSYKDSLFVVKGSRGMHLEDVVKYFCNRYRL